jgi:HEAT repeat protein
MRGRFVIRLASVLAATVAIVGCDSGPVPGEEALYFGKQLVEATEQPKRDAAAAKLMELKDKRSLPSIYAALKGPVTETKPMLVDMLGLFGDATSVEPLVDAIDLTAGAGRDKETRINATANEKAINAIARLRDTVPNLGDNKRLVDTIRKLTTANNENVQLAAVITLGQLKCKDAVEELIQIADGHPNNFMVKNAVLALNEIVDPRAAPAFGRLLFFERGVSFYAEASYGLFLIGKPSLPILREIYDGKFKAIETLHVEPGVQRAKAMVVAADIADPSTNDWVIKGVDEQGNGTATVLTRLQAQDAAGRLGLQAAVKGMRNRIDNADISQSEHALNALTAIGARDIAGPMYAWTTSEGALKQCAEQGGNTATCAKSEDQIRKARLLAWSRLAPGTDFAKAEKMVADEKNPKLKAVVEVAKERMAVAKECGSDVKCFIGKTKSESVGVRDRSAYELLWASAAGNNDARDALIPLLSDKDNEVRYAAILGVMRRLPTDSVPLADVLKKQLDAERGQQQFIRINEDLKRLETKLRRGY